MILDFVSLVLLAAAALGCVYMIVAAVLIWRYLPFENSSIGIASAVTILKPLHGDEEGLFENLASFCRQEYSGAVQIVFGVASANDPAIAVVEQLRSTFPRMDIELVIDGRVSGNNPKASNLVNMQGHIRHETIIVADSDIRVKSDYLTQIASALDRHHGAVTVPYFGMSNGTVFSKLSQLAIDSHFLPGVLVGARFGLARPCLGSTIAFRKAALEAIGGFVAVADCLADDHKLGELFGNNNYPVKLLPFAVDHICNENSFAGLWRHELRWALTIRTIDPLGYIGWAFDHAFAFALFAWIVLGAGWSGLMLTFAALICRSILIASCEKRFDLNRRPYWLIPIRELLSFAVFIAGFTVRDVTWRGRQYKLMSQGTLSTDRRLPTL